MIKCILDNVVAVDDAVMLLILVWIIGVVVATFPLIAYRSVGYIACWLFIYRGKLLWEDVHKLHVKCIYVAFENKSNDYKNCTSKVFILSSWVYNNTDYYYRHNPVALQFVSSIDCLANIIDIILRSRDEDISSSFLLGN